MTIASAAVVALTIAIFAIRAVVKPASVLAVDLTGGTSIVFDVQEGKMPSVADVRKTLNPFDNATVIQTQGSDKLLVKTGYTSDNAKDKGVTDVAGHVTKLLKDAFPDAGIERRDASEIGSVVGADLKKSGTWAVVLSLCAILIYVAFRFEFGFGLGALVALAHDALISLGLFSLCGRQVSLLVITALLTIIGYSVNDTIVVFDRIREDLHVHRPLQPRPQRVPEPHGDHLDHHVLRGARALRVRRRLDLRLRADDAHRRHRGHLLVGVHRDAHHDVVLQGPSPEVHGRRFLEVMRMWIPSSTRPSGSLNPM